jgi:hypothetical protein
MITVGVVRELAYISQHAEKPLYVAMDMDGKYVSLRVEENSIRVSYQAQLIWEENIYGEGNWFGVESCDEIKKIMDCVDNGEPWIEKHSWKKSNNTNYCPLDIAIEKSEKNE